MGAAAGAVAMAAKPATYDIISGKNPRGIPKGKFVDDVAAFIKASGAGKVDPILAELQELFSKYKYYEMNLLRKKGTLQNKLPEIKKSLEMVNYLIAQRAAGSNISTNFPLSDNVYAKANINCADGDQAGQVCLWLGAKVMMQYSYEEALELLTNNLSGASSKLAEVNEDLVCVRENIILTEVNIARIFNWDVKRRRALKAAGGGGDSK